MTALRILATVALLALTASSLTSCSDSSACETTDDCFGGEVCRGGECLVVVEGDAGNNGSDNNGTGNNGAGDAGPSNNGTSTDAAGNNGSGNNGTANNGTGGPECAVDPFDTECANDSYEPNESWTDSEHYFDANTPFGCFSEFRPIDDTISATLCPLESADYFDFMYNTCKDYAYNIEFEFRPTNQCTNELVNFEFMNHSCEDADTNCEALENGGMRIRHIVAQTPVQSNTKAAYIRVVPGSSEQKVQVPYEIKARLYQ